MLGVGEAGHIITSHFLLSRITNNISLVLLSPLVIFTEGTGGLLQASSLLHINAVGEVLRFSLCISVTSWVVANGVHEHAFPQAYKDKHEVQEAF